MSDMLLRIIRAYQRFTPMPVRSFLTRGRVGTSAAAYEQVAAGAAPLKTFVLAALPLRILGRALGIYEGQGNW